MYIFIVEDTQSTTVESQGTHRAAHGWGREGQYLRCALPSVPTPTTPTTTPLLRQQLLVLLNTSTTIAIALVVVGSSSVDCCQSAGAANQ